MLTLKKELKCTKTLSAHNNYRPKIKNPATGEARQRRQISYIIDEMESADNLPSKKSFMPRWLSVLAIIFVGLLAFIIGGGISYLIINRPAQRSAPTSQSAGVLSETKQKTKTCSGKLFSNQAFGYQSCYPADWQVIEFDESLALVGFNPAALDPEGQEFGILHITVIERSAPEIITELKNTLNQATTSGFDINNLSGTLINGINKSDQKIHPDYPERNLVIPRTSNQTVVITFVAKSDEFDKYLPFWQELIDNFKIEA